MARKMTQRKSTGDRGIAGISYLPYPRTPHIDIDTSPSPRAAESPLERLNHDVIACILDFLRMPIDLRNICLANHKMRLLGLPHLYRTIDLDVDEYTHQVAHGLLNLRNAGLKYIRRVFLTDIVEYGTKSSKWVEKFIEGIPAHQLLEFRLKSKHASNTNLVEMLWRWHRDLCNIQMLTPHNDAELDKLHGYPFRKEMARYTALELVPRDTETLLAACNVLQQCKITHLDLDARHYIGGAAKRDSGSGDVIDAMTRTLFHYTGLGIHNTIRTKVASLAHFQLADVGLRFCRETWFEYLMLSGLKTLSLEYCGHADIFLAELMRASAPRFDRLNVVHSIGAGDRTVVELEDLLNKSPSCIRRLTLCLRNADRGPIYSAINAQRDTLRHLVLDVTTTNRDADGLPVPFVYCDSDLETMLTGCSNLSQLALHTSPPSMTCARFYKDATGTVQVHSRKTWDIIFTKVSLTTINLLGWPEGYKPRQLSSEYTAMQPQLRHLATDLLYSGNRHNNVRRLEIVAFGTRERSYDFAQPVPRYFVEGEVTSMRRTERIACQSDLRDLYREGMAVDILHHDWRDYDQNDRRVQRIYYLFDEEAYEEDW